MDGYEKLHQRTTVIGATTGFVLLVIALWIAVVTGVWTTIADLGLMATFIGPIFVLGGVVMAHTIDRARRDKS